MQSGDSSASQKAASPGGEVCSHPRRSVSQSWEAYKACKPTSLQCACVPNARSVDALATARHVRLVRHPLPYLACKKRKMSTIAPTLPERPVQTDALVYSNLDASARVAYRKAAGAAWRRDPKNAESIRASAKRYREGHKAECAAANKVYKARAYSKQADIDRRLDLLTEAHITASAREIRCARCSGRARAAPRQIRRTRPHPSCDPTRGHIS
jgi:hypothetical protein